MRQGALERAEHATCADPERSAAGDCQRQRVSSSGPSLSRTATASPLGSSTFPLDLEAIRQIKLPNAIQVQRRGARRLPNLREALAMVLGSLGTLSRSSGVRTLNTELNGKPVALAFIEGARFGEDNEGNTTLNEIEEAK